MSLEIFKFLYKYFNRFINELRINGNYQGEVLILTDYFTPTFISLKYYLIQKLKLEDLKELNFHQKQNIHFKKFKYK